MTLTLGFIAFFVSIIIPGILFKRFFYFGEFSKQFNTKEPVLHSIFLSIIPGIVIQILSFVIYIISLDFDSSLFDVFVIFRDIASDGSTGTRKETEYFINNQLISFLLYSLCVFILASFLGYLSSRIIRNRKWDRKYKIFRFKNQWYYIFSGEVLNMKKFEEAHKVSFKKNKGKNQDILMTYADILVSVSDQNDRKELYTGYVVDYDLSSDDISQLDKVYLIDTYRYKKKEKLFNESGIELKDQAEKQIKENPTKSRNRLRVPGDIFVLNAKNIVNLNLTYIPSLHKEMDKKVEEKRKDVKRQSRYKTIQNIYFFIILALIMAHFFYRPLSLDKTIFGDYLLKTGFWGKLLIILFINHLLSFAIPTLDDEKKLNYNSKNVWFRLIILVIMGVLSYLVVLKNLY